MQHIITPKEVGSLCRFCGMDDDDMDKIIADVEQLDLKPQIGSELLASVLSNPEQHKDLLTGSTYEVCGSMFIHNGLKKAAAFYAYARAVKNSGGRLTRSGWRTDADDQYSKGDSVERRAVVKDYLADADQYLGEVLKFLKDTGYPLYRGGRKVKQTRMKTYIIG